MMNYKHIKIVLIHQNLIIPYLYNMYIFLKLPVALHSV